MRAAVLSIGTELTRGELLNSNAFWLADQLTKRGFEVTRLDCCDDDRTRIQQSLAQLGADHAVIVCTGGLGPTTDDITTESVAALLNVPLERDAASLAFIASLFQRFGRTMSESNKKQADFPKGAAILPNPNGTAPGFSVRIGQAQAFFTPGVPREMEPMFRDHIAPKLAAPSDQYQLRFRTFGKPESEVGEMLAGIEERFAGITIGYRATFPEIEVKVLARAEDPRALCERASTEVRQRLAACIVSEGEETIAQLVLHAFRSAKRTLSFAESCTGGLASSMLTAEAGSSDVFSGAAVTYANTAKTALLGVSPALLEAHGAVSSEVAAAMAEGARNAFDTDVAVSITGIAGPSGGTEKKPVGLVFMAVATASGTTTHEYKFRGDRFRIQRTAAYQCLRLALKEAATYPASAG